MLERWFGGDEPVDHYELRYLPPSGGSWRRATHADLAEDVGELSNKLEESHIRQTAETENWKPGTYALQGRRTDGTLTDFIWRFELEGEIENESDEQLRRLERKIDRLENGDSEPVDPEEALERLQYEVAAEAMQNEAFMKEYGEQIAVEALGLGSSGGVDLEDIDEYGSLAVAVDAWNDPSGIEARAEQAGRAFSAALDGFDAGSGGDTTALSSGGEDADNDGEPVEESLSEQTADEDTGPELSRPEARYCLRFPDQYTDEQVSEAREVLTDAEVAEIEDKRERDESSAESGSAERAAATDGGIDDDDDDDEEPVTDGGMGADLGVPGMKVDSLDALRRFQAWMDRTFSRSELEELADEMRTTETPASKRAKRYIRDADDIRAVQSGHDRERFVKAAARDLLGRRGGRSARPDGGRVRSRQSLVDRLKPRHVVGILVVLVLLFGGGSR